MPENWGWYPPSKPRAVEGGLTARSRRGAIGQTWWSERFIEVLAGMGMGSRLQRGRAYARKGQVVSLDIAPGLVTAVVQGSRARPYRVRIGLSPYDKAEWGRVEAALADSAWYAARLLAGDMPPDIEELFRSLSLTLFPEKAKDLSLDCSCPDHAVPCKHVAAAFYLLAEKFDEDPFDVLAWRGRERGDLLENLRAERGGPVAADASEGGGPPLEDCVHSFFECQGPLPGRSAPLSSVDSVLYQVPDVSVTVLRRDLVDLLRPAYAALGARYETSSEHSAD